MIRIVLISLLLCSPGLYGQTLLLRGTVSCGGQSVFPASILLEGRSMYGIQNDSAGRYRIHPEPGEYAVSISAFGYITLQKTLHLFKDTSVNFELHPSDLMLQETLITGTQKEVSRSESPVPVEVYTPAFFRKNPSASLIDAMQTVNGVRPQLNCNVCNTGDIHINGMEGPYTMVLIDGMPIVSALASVYGLSGIPNSLIERVEIVKGPAASLYGSESVGGLINVITKKNAQAPAFSADVFTTSWMEHNADLGFHFKPHSKVSVLTGVNYFNYSHPKDLNKDNFTDVTLQNRISAFQKWDFERKKNRLFNVAGRYLYEDRWGGQMNWTPAYRGSDSIYGESISTRRWEILGNYRLPLEEKITLSFCANQHMQDSYYGITPYKADQRIGFAQLNWDKSIDRHDLLAGTAIRYTYYDDNSTATMRPDSANAPSIQILPGFFLQDEISMREKHKLLLGSRIDLHSVHGPIFTPRIAYKWSVSQKHILRWNAGSGFRVVNLFSEDHAALTGARQVEIRNELRPERSYNTNLNYIYKTVMREKVYLSLDVSVFYTYFLNRIMANYDADPNKIIYDNLSGHSEIKGSSLNLEVSDGHKLKAILGATYLDALIIEQGKRTRQILTERFSGTWTFSYKFTKAGISLDYTGNIYSPMRVPTLGELDPRKEFSPWWSIQNLQVTYSLKRMEIYGGIKNLLDWTPNIGNPFIIARSNDPFDKSVKLDAQGQVIPTADNPYALTFDPTYVYGPNQGRRFFIGVRMTVK